WIGPVVARPLSGSLTTKSNAPRRGRRTSNSALANSPGSSGTSGLRWPWPLWLPNPSPGPSVANPGGVRSFSGMSSCPVETDGSAVGEPPGGATGVVGVVPNEVVGAAGTAVRVAGAAVRVAGGPAGDSGAAGAAGPAGGSV